MIIKRKTQIIVALLVSSIFLFQNCATLILRTSERRFPERKYRATLIITIWDGRQIEGELFAVKKDSLLLFLAKINDVYVVGIKNIKVIRVKKKSKALVGATYGALAGGGIGAIFSTLIGKPAPIILSSMGAEESTILGGIFFGFIIGAVCGGITGALLGTDKTIRFEGMSDSEIREALDKLRKKARIRDYK